MGIVYIAVCDSKKEYFDPGELGLATKWPGWGTGPAGRALLSAMHDRWYDGAVRFVSDAGDEYHDLTDGKNGYDDVTGEVWHHYHWMPQGERDERIEEDCRYAWCPVCKQEGEDHRQNRMLADFLSFYRDQHALTAAQHEIRFEIGDKNVRDVAYEDVRQVLHAAIRGFLHEYQKVEQDLPEPVRTRSVLLKLARDVALETSKILPLISVESEGKRDVMDGHYIESEEILRIVQDLQKRAQAILGEEEAG